MNIKNWIKQLIALQRDRKLRGKRIIDDLHCLRHSVNLQIRRTCCLLR